MAEKQVELTYTERVEKEEAARIEKLKKEGWFFTEWGEFVPPRVEVDNRKPSNKKKETK